jgi:hypothetical protein
MPLVWFWKWLQCSRTSVNVMLRDVFRLHDACIWTDHCHLVCFVSQPVAVLYCALKLTWTEGWHFWYHIPFLLHCLTYMFHLMPSTNQFFFFWSQVWRCRCFSRNCYGFPSSLPANSLKYTVTAVHHIIPIYNKTATWHNVTCCMLINTVSISMSDFDFGYCPQI